jgi:ferrous iron transport protein B
VVEIFRRTSVASCHNPAAGPVRAVGVPVVALVGAPNVGKTTLFNALTGARRETGNWPGTSVEVGHGSWQLPGCEVAVVDLPGTYSLDPLSTDEALVRTLLIEVEKAERPDVTVVVLDATSLARSLYLLAQVRERPCRVVAAVTMNDVAAARGVRVDAGRLAVSAGMAVVPLDPRRGVGVNDLATVVAAAIAGPVLPPLHHTPPPHHEPPSHHTPPQHHGPPPHHAPPQHHDVEDEDPLTLDATGGPPPDDLGPLDDLDPLDAADTRFAWIDRMVEAAQNRTHPARLTRTDRIDRVVTSPVGGALVFLAAMWLLFQTTTTVAGPLQGQLSGLLSGPVTSDVTRLLALLGLRDAVVSGFVVQGLLPGVGMLLTFVPLMTLMFAALSVLEESGYMARAAVVAARLMRVLHLPGQAFLPLVVGFSCNVPAVLGTRVLPNARHRLLTALLVPFTSCSARLTVYVLVAGVFFPTHAGSVVFAMYLVSILFVVVIGLALRSTVLRDLTREPLMIDLPAYHLPVPRLVLRSTWTRLRGFLTTAGGLIVGTVAVVWLVQTVPVQSGDRFGDVPVERSLYAAAARAVAPVFAPAGFGDWHTTSALMTGFVAKEAVISTWAQTAATQRPPGGTVLAGPAAGPPGTADPQTLGYDVRSRFVASSGGHPGAAAWAFLVFLLAYTPCVATLATQKRELGLRWTVFGIATQLTTAWLVAVAVFQIARALT